VQEFDPRQGALSGLTGLESAHRVDHPFHRTMVLFHHIIEVADLPNGHDRPVLLIVALNGCRTGLAAINRDGLRHAVAADCLGEKAQGGCAMPLGGDEEVSR
jgi:hypothetical protein